MDREGKREFQPAAVVLCAANGVGTARALPVSANSAFPDGLANSSGLVGKRLMMHNQAMVFGLFDDNLESWQGQWERRFNRSSSPTPTSVAASCGCACWVLSPAGGPMRAALPVGRPAVWGAEHHRVVRERSGRTAVWDLLCEDLPDEKNCVELATVLRFLGHAGTEDQLHRRRQREPHARVEHRPRRIPCARQAHGKWKWRDCCRPVT